MTEDDYRPEKNWRDRTAPILYMPSVPRDITKLWLTVKNIYGIDIANLLVSAYKLYGRRVAKSIGYKLLRFRSFDEVLEYLQEKIMLFDPESKKLLSGLIYSYKYNYYLDKLVKELKNTNDCAEAGSIALRVFHILAARNIFYNPSCIVEYARIKAGCDDRVSSVCKDVHRNIELYCGGDL